MLGTLLATGDKNRHMELTAEKEERLKQCALCSCLFFSPSFLLRDSLLLFYAASVLRAARLSHNWGGA